MAVKAKDAEKLRFIEEMTSNVDAVQVRVLAEILGGNADTKYLKNCGLGGATGSPSLPPNTKPASNQLQGMATETGAAATFREVHGAEHLPNGALLLGKNRAAELGALYSSAAAVFAPRENGMPFGEALLGKNRIVGLAAPCSNAAVFAHPRGMAAGEALRPTPGPPYVVQVSIDEVMGAKVGGPIAVEAKIAGADAGDVLGSGGNLSAFLGIVAVSSAVTIVAAEAVSPTVAFGFFVILLGGLSLAMSAVHGA